MQWMWTSIPIAARLFLMIWAALGLLGLAGSSAQ
jgi:hypothetical protein